MCKNEVMSHMHAGMALNISDLPDEVLGDISSWVPLSKAKVAAQCVCKTWLKVLQTTTAHSTDTIFEDEYVEFLVDPIAPVEKDGVTTQLLSEGFVNALACLKFKDDRDDLDDPDINALLTGYLPLWSAYPLKLLHVVELRNMMCGSEDVKKLFQEFAMLPNLKYVKVRASIAEGIVDFHGPEECRVNFEMSWFYNRDPDHPGSIDFEVPEGMAKHLQQLSLCDRWETVERDPPTDSDDSDEDGPPNIKRINLGRLQNCHFLESIIIDLDSTRGVQAYFYGMDALPASVHSIFVLYTEKDCNRHMWQTAPGWHIADNGFFRLFPYPENQ